ncbi:hypothetical protein BV494_21620 (plasmid) [Rahnella sikkimica]|uniref:Uncharacterized protein n=1 Tax=Rahnella sikkimica TaxID=1805933 RepID=A0A2L1UX47_9GAMM|nr:hypothetical protein BV494_21620 [Rahnella sikkimica]
MKKKFCLSLACMITSFYTVAVFFALDGLSRNGIFEIVAQHTPFFNPLYLLSTLILICIGLNIFSYYCVSKKIKNHSKPLLIIILSFVIGMAIISIVARFELISKSIYETYIYLFYQGVHYEGEEKNQQLMSYITRLIPLCFLLGGAIAWLCSQTFSKFRGSLR